MALTTAQIKQLNFSSQYGMDKVLFTDSGTLTVGARLSTYSPNSSSTTVLHDVEGLALPVMIWSINGTDWYPAGAGYSGANGFANPTTQTVEPSCKVTNIDYWIGVRNWTAGSVTIQYKIALLGVD